MDMQIDNEVFFYDPYPADMFGDCLSPSIDMDKNITDKISMEIEEIQIKIEAMLNRYKKYKQLGLESRCASIQTRVSGFIQAKNNLVSEKIKMQAF